jgi:hypothetical protein
MTKPGLSILDRPGFVRFAGKGVRALIRFWGLWLPAQSRSRRVDEIGDRAQRPMKPGLRYRRPGLGAHAERLRCCRRHSPIPR